MPNANKWIEQPEIRIDETGAEGDAESYVILKVSTNSWHISHEWDVVFFEMFLWSYTTAKSQRRSNVLDGFQRNDTSTSEAAV